MEKLLVVLVVAASSALGSLALEQQQQQQQQQSLYFVNNSRVVGLDDPPALYRFTVGKPGSLAKIGGFSGFGPEESIFSTHATVCGDLYVTGFVSPGAIGPSAGLAAVNTKTGAASVLGTGQHKQPGQIPHAFLCDAAAKKVYYLSSSQQSNTDLSVYSVSTAGNFSDATPTLVGKPDLGARSFVWSLTDASFSVRQEDMTFWASYGREGVVSGLYGLTFAISATQPAKTVTYEYPTDSGVTVFFAPPPASDESKPMLAVTQEKPLQYPLTMHAAVAHAASGKITLSDSRPVSGDLQVFEQPIAICAGDAGFAVTNNNYNFVEFQVSSGKVVSATPVSKLFGSQIYRPGSFACA